MKRKFANVVTVIAVASVLIATGTLVTGMTAWMTVFQLAMMAWAG